MHATYQEVKCFRSSLCFSGVNYWKCMVSAPQGSLRAYTRLLSGSETFRFHPMRWMIDTPAPCWSVSTRGYYQEVRHSASTLWHGWLTLRRPVDLWVYTHGCYKEVRHSASTPCGWLTLWHPVDLWVHTRGCYQEVGHSASTPWGGWHPVDLWVHTRGCYQEVGHSASTPWGGWHPVDLWVHTRGSYHEVHLNQLEAGQTVHWSLHWKQTGFVSYTEKTECLYYIFLSSKTFCSCFFGVFLLFEYFRLSSQSLFPNDLEEEIGIQKQCYTGRERLIRTRLIRSST